MSRFAFLHNVCLGCKSMQTYSSVANVLKSENLKCLLGSAKVIKLTVLMKFALYSKYDQILSIEYVCSDKQI